MGLSQFMKYPYIPTGLTSNVTITTAVRPINHDADHGTTGKPPGASYLVKYITCLRLNAGLASCGLLRGSNVRLFPFST
jgi:hypothetical protein